ncbi:MAG TPA: hypothetical protein VFN71_10140, partial [Methylomirabilota bacterium]|nr:hypothetical protein [Methylomirabilota bacterium]
MLITGAGAAGSENLVLSLRGTGARLALIGCHIDRFVLKKSSADRNYLIHAPSHPEFLESLR